MSVCIINDGEMQKFFNRLVYEEKGGKQSRLKVIPDREIMNYKKLVMEAEHIQEYEARMEAIKIKLDAFVSRAAMANRLAFCMEYNDPQIRKPELKTSSLHILGDEALFRFVQMLKYNCVTNQGYTTLPGDVEKALDGLLIQLGEKAIENMDNLMKGEK
jgi:hypothetical protein